LHTSKPCCVESKRAIIDAKRTETWLRMCISDYNHTGHPM
jgi:hypothetical protein